MFKINYNLSNIDSIAKETLEVANHTVICFEGEMGAGKTRLIKSILKQLGYEEEISSPTFGIVNEYEILSGEKKVYHFDLYRIENEDELYDLGFEDYLDTRQLVLIEWPNIAINLLPTKRTIVKLKIVENEERELTIINKDGM